MRLDHTSQDAPGRCRCLNRRIIATQQHSHDINVHIMTSPQRSGPPKRILIVTGDCPSHPYACAKLATVLTSSHDVTLAGPNGMALERVAAAKAAAKDAALAFMYIVHTDDWWNRPEFDYVNADDIQPTAGTRRRRRSG